MTRLLPILFLCLSLSLSAWGVPNPLYFSNAGGGNGATALTPTNLSGVSSVVFPTGQTNIQIGQTSHFEINSSGSTWLMLSTNLNWNSFGLVFGSGLSNIVVDGQNVGVITCGGSNGTGLPLQTADVQAVYCSGGAVQNLTFENIAIVQVYLHTSVTDLVNSPDGCCGMNLSTSGIFTCSNVTFGDVGDAISLSGTASNQLVNCTFTNYNKCWYLQAGTSFHIAGNLCGNATNWQTSADKYHNNGYQYVFASSPNFLCTESNTFMGPIGNECTSWAFADGSFPLTNLYRYNFVRAWPADSLQSLYEDGGTVTNNTFYNQSASPTLTCGTFNTINNNLFYGGDEYVSIGWTNSQATFASNNLYANFQGTSAWQVGGTNINVYATYTNLVHESGSFNYTNTSAGIVNSDGSLPAGSPALYAALGGGNIGAWQNPVSTGGLTINAGVGPTTINIQPGATLIIKAQ